MAGLPSLALGSNPDQVNGNSNDGDLRARKAKMTDVTGVKVTDLTACGTSDDGEHVWITHRLGDGTEYPLGYPFEAVGYLITVLADAVRSAQRRRVALNPEETAEGADTDVIPIPAARVGASPDNSGAILH